MIFSSPFFIFFFLPITILLLKVSSLLFNGNFNKITLLFLSLVFYSLWNVYNLPIIIISLLVNYIISVFLERGNKKLFIIGIIFNILYLAYYKYSAFILNEIFGLLINVNITLPLAISFFTFQQIAYLSDRYQGKVKQPKIIDYSLFVCFFPQLIAGPIVHHKDLVPQFDKYKFNLSGNAFLLGVFIFSIGMFKKVVFADSLAGFVDYGFSLDIYPFALDSYSFIQAWSIALAYAFQLYFDFSGYCDMALGVAIVFCIKLPWNFDSPYKAKNIQEFWRKWHMTLGLFFKDYIYVLLGGSRTTWVYINLFIVAFISGVWHGAGYNFILWGSIHGGAMILHRFYSKNFKINRASRLYQIFSIIITFLFVVTCWVIFRADNLDVAFNIIKSMYSLDRLTWDFNVLLSHFQANGVSGVYNKVLFKIGLSKMVIMMMMLAIITCFFGVSSKLLYESYNQNKNRYYLLTLVLFFISILWQFSMIDSPDFLYFNF